MSEAFGQGWTVTRYVTVQPCIFLPAYCGIVNVLRKNLFAV